MIKLRIFGTRDKYNMGMEGRILGSVNIMHNLNPLAFDFCQKLRNKFVPLLLGITFNIMVKT